MIYMFYNCSSLTNFNLGNLYTNSVNNIDSIFFDCVESIILTNFNTYKTNMEEMFYGCKKLNNN